MANGPEDEVTGWLSVNWQQAEDDVRRLRQRIFTATKAGDLAKVRNLQKLMLRSRANALISVRRVTEINAGRETAGIDGKTALLAPQKAELAGWVQHRSGPWKPRPVKRVFIPKASGRQRPLGIPVIADRALQAVVLGALEPEWEARFEPKSYGFRPGRGCHDAIEAIFCTVAGRNPHRRWILDADLAAAFDRIDHGHLMASLGTFPARDRIGQWLTAGVIEQGWFTPTREGTPQGGVASPLMMNVALHGLEAAAGVRYFPGGRKDAGKSVPGSPVVVRYADDLVALCVSAEQAQQVKDSLARWLAPRGLAFNEDKTRIVRLEDGFDFLGFSIRRYPNGKLLIKPSTAAVQRIRSRLAAEVKALHGANAEAVINTLNPVIRGWAAYYRTVVSKEIFSSLDHYVWRLTYRWALRAHPNKPKRWVTARYFGAFHPARRDRWVFGDRDSGRYLVKFSWTPIVRHRLVTGGASPDDPALASYWARRRRRGRPPLGPFLLRLLQSQEGRCPGCGGLLLHADREPQGPDEWEQWLKSLRKAISHTAIASPGGGPPDENARCLMHTSCARHRNTTRAATPLLLPPSHQGLLEPCAWKPGKHGSEGAGRVVWGRGGVSAPRLPDNTAADHITATRLALSQLPADTRRRVLIRCDSGGGTHEFLNWLAKPGRRLQYSAGFTITDDVQHAIMKIPARAWTPAYDGNGQVRDGAWLAELTGLLDLAGWPKGMRIIVRKERPHPGAQLRFTDINGHRFTCFATSTRHGQLADLELRHRRRARCEDRIRNAKDTGLRNLPLHGYGQNQIWCQIVALACELLAWTAMLALTGTARRWEPKRLRLRLFSSAGQIVRGGRRIRLRLAARWPWSSQTSAATSRLHALKPG